MNRLPGIVMMILTIGFYSCKCDSTNYRLNDRQRSFSNFKAGTYWIMVDSVTAQRDSLVVLSGETSQTQGGNGSAHCADQVEARTFAINAYDLATGRSRDLSMTLTVSGQGNNVYTFQKGNDPILYDIVSLDFYRSGVNVLGNYYDSVAVNDYNQVNAHVQLYFHPQQVLLKVGYKTGTDHYVWQLERAHIIR